MSTTNPQPPPATPISTLIASWTDLDVLVGVEDGSLPISTPQVVRRPLREVKDRFESTGLHPILCPRLIPADLPRFIIFMNDPCINETELRRRFSENPCLVARQVLAQKAANPSSRYYKDTCWIKVEQGEVSVTAEGYFRTTEERIAFDSNPGPGQLASHGAAHRVSLRPGDLIVIPGLSVFFMTFSEDTLMLMGEIKDGEGDGLSDPATRGREGAKQQAEPSEEPNEEAGVAAEGEGVTAATAGTTQE
jgi:hypothetical protein